MRLQGLTGLKQFLSHIVDLELDVLCILLFEGFVGEDELGAGLLEDDLVQAFQVVVVEPAAQDVLVQLLTELHDLAQLLLGHIVLRRVGLSPHEHLVVLFPVLLEVGVLQDNQVDDVESDKGLAKVVEDLGIDMLLETVGKHAVFRIEETVHLVHDVLR